MMNFSTPGPSSTSPAPAPSVGKGFGAASGAGDTLFAFAGGTKAGVGGGGPERSAAWMLVEDAVLLMAKPLSPGIDVCWTGIQRYIYDEELLSQQLSLPVYEKDAF